MISLDVKDYCHDCPDFVPDSEQLMQYSDDFIPRMMISNIVKCKNADKCAAMMKYLKSQMEDKR